MRFLLDQDVYAVTGRFLESLGHDVVRAGSIGLASAADDRLLEVAEQQGRLLVTRDRDFGGLVFVRQLGAGVLYLRILPTTVHSVHAVLQQVLALHSELELKSSFVVIEPGSYRVRRLPAP
jgi:predicted nuclease of predicted toxin-antitoxin system